MNSRTLQGRILHCTIISALLLLASVYSGCETTTSSKYRYATYPSISEVNFRQGQTYSELLNQKTSKTNQYTPGYHAWAPAVKEKTGRWKGIMIHHSATASGNAHTIDQLHKDRQWDGLGYHFVINNGNGADNGKVEVGYRWKNQEKGAHCRVHPNDNNYWNEHTIGICLIGNFEFSQPSQSQYNSLAQLVKFLQDRYNIPTSQIVGHNHAKVTKCPGKHFSFWKLKQQL